MGKRKFETSDLYGVFCSDGTFRVYYYGIIEDTVHCLFDKKIFKNTIMKEEIKLFPVIVVYDPNDSVKIKSQDWMNGQVFTYDNKYYRAIKLDTILDEILCNNYVIDNTEAVIQLENTINKRLQENILWYRDIWKNILSEEDNQVTLSYARKLKQD